MFAATRVTLEAPVKRWLAYCHGEAPDPVRQVQFHRCEGCHGIVTWHQIRDGGCACAMSSRVRATRLSLFEKFRLLVLPWTI